MCDTVDDALKLNLEGKDFSKCEHCLVNSMKIWAPINRPLFNRARFCYRNNCCLASGLIADCNEPSPIAQSHFRNAHTCKTLGHFCLARASLWANWNASHFRWQFLIDISVHFFEYCHGIIKATPSLPNNKQWWFRSIELFWVLLIKNFEFL